MCRQVRHPAWRPRSPCNEQSWHMSQPWSLRRRVSAHRTFHRRTLLVPTSHTPARSCLPQALRPQPAESQETGSPGCPQPPASSPVPTRHQCFRPSPWLSSQAPLFTLHPDPPCTPSGPSLVGTVLPGPSYRSIRLQFEAGAKVCQADMPTAVQENVIWLDVPVHRDGGESMLGSLPSRFHPREESMFLDPRSCPQ